MKNKIVIFMLVLIFLLSIGIFTYAWLILNKKVISDGINMDIDTSEQEGSGFNIKENSLNINGEVVKSNNIVIYPGDTFSYTATTTNNVNGFYISVLEPKKTEDEFREYFLDKGDLLLGLYSENINGTYYDFDDSLL